MKQGAPLNTAQQEAVLTTDGPLLVLAGAGAGKTKVIAERIAQIVRQGIAPNEVLAITFTNKAAGEMRERITPGVFVSTFHVLGLTIIKENYRLLGLKGFPAIYDRADSMREMKAALKAVGAEDIEPRAALGIASRQKGSGVPAGEYAESAQTPYERSIGLAWLKYEAALRKDGAMDFDDLLLRAFEIVRDHQAVRERYQKRWRYIHIDEYQDTNVVQAMMASHLVGPGRNICAVGDIDQTIYGWRGAEIANILAFEKKYPGAKVVLLEQNYRSTKRILAAANEVISKNAARVDKNLFTDNPEGDPISLYIAFDETDEAGFVTRKIKELIAQGRQPKDFAILYRANSQSRALEEQLLAGGVSYQVLGTRFFERREIKDVLSFIRGALNGNSADMARAAQAIPRGIGKVTLLKMLEGQPAGPKADEFLHLLQKIRLASNELPPSKLVAFVIRESGMEQHFKEDKYEGAERLENIRELASLAARYDHLIVAPGEEGAVGEALQNFLESAALASDQDELKDEQNAVRLMTVHAAKGLEFPVVFITGLEEGLFPYERPDDDANNKEEERRLMYVALTRARHKLYLCYASYRTVYGAKMSKLPSQFLSDIPGDLLENENPERLGRTIYLD
jgi:DNA helicase II / ATP-dependent DNA helicase PcrA